MEGSHGLQIMVDKPVQIIFNPGERKSSLQQPFCSEGAGRAPSQSTVMIRLAPFVGASAFEFCLPRQTRTPLRLGYRNDNGRGRRLVA